MTEYLFEYHFGGSTWGITIHADSVAEAKEKIKAVGMASYKGSNVIRIPVPGGTTAMRVWGWLTNGFGNGGR